MSRLIAAIMVLFFLPTAWAEETQKSPRDPVEELIQILEDDNTRASLIAKLKTSDSAQKESKPL